MDASVTGCTFVLLNNTAMRINVFSAAFLSGLSVVAQSELTDTVKLLNEVIVSVEKPHIRGEDGIMTVDLPSIIKDKPVTNILEALSYMAGVTNNNGMVWLTGASNVTIILNGKLTGIPIQNLYQLLYNTPVDRLKNVEIMYSAPAKYHVNGAVINVVLKTPTPLDGLQGQVRTGYNQAHYGSYGGVLAATYAIKDWSFDLNYGLTRSKSWSREETWSNHLYNGKRTMFGAVSTVRLSPIQRVGIFHRAPWVIIRMPPICYRRWATIIYHCVTPRLSA